MFGIGLPPYVAYIIIMESATDTDSMPCSDSGENGVGSTEHSQITITVLELNTSDAGKFGYERRKSDGMHHARVAASELRLKSTS